MGVERQIPEDLKEQYERVKRSHPSMGWLWTLPLFERIADLAAEVGQKDALIERLQKACEAQKEMFEDSAAANESLKGLLREYRKTNEKHHLCDMRVAGLVYLTQIDDRCDLCKRTDQQLQPTQGEQG